ncbi:sulfurtransferase [Rhodococcus globerulus]|uniref:sulfurtransferase n=1 Tax=Rhodococcus globerulus TaxID=33008 RepID=UPI00374E6C37
MTGTSRQDCKGFPLAHDGRQSTQFAANPDDRLRLRCHRSSSASATRNIRVLDIRQARRTQPRYRALGEVRLRTVVVGVAVSDSRGSAVQSSLRRWGVDEHTSVVVYDDWNRAGSSRARCVLQAAGIRDVSILDGGWKAWNKAGFAAETDVPVVTPSHTTATHHDLEQAANRTVSADEAADLATNSPLVDARAAERFRGDIEPLDPIAGHIPALTTFRSSRSLTTTAQFAHPPIFVPYSRAAAWNRTGRRVSTAARTSPQRWCSRRWKSLTTDRPHCSLDLGHNGRRSPDA